MDDMTLTVVDVHDREQGLITFVKENDEQPVEMDCLVVGLRVLFADEGDVLEKVDIRLCIPQAVGPLLLEHLLTAKQWEAITCCD